MPATAIVVHQHILVQLNGFKASLRLLTIHTYIYDFTALSGWINIYLFEECIISHILAVTPVFLQTGGDAACKGKIKFL
jgi:hypothetical protein